MKNKLSWKFLIAFGIIWLIIFHNSALALIGTIALIFGIIDLVRSLMKRKEGK